MYIGVHVWSSLGHLGLCLVEEGGVGAGAFGLEGVLWSTDCLCIRMETRYPACNFLCSVRRVGGRFW